MKTRIFFAAVVTCIGLSAASIALAATPTLAISGVGSDLVQLETAGDANSTVVLFYNVGSTAGVQTSILGTTDGGGKLSKTISVSGLGLNTSNNVYVMVNSQPSATKPWASTTSGTTTTSSSAPSLSQTSVTIGLSQSVTIVSQASTNSVYMLSSSNPSVASVLVNGTQAAVTGNQLGTTSIQLCYVGSSSNCATLSVTVQTAATTTTSTGSITFDRTNPTVAVGAVTTVNVSGGSGYYVNGNSVSGLTLQTINGSSIIITGVAAGTTVLTICPVTGTCGTLSVTVGTSATSGATGQGITFSTANPTLIIGQALNVSLSGASSYFISTVSNPIPVQTTLSGNTLTLSGVTSGSTSVSVCASGGTSICGTLSVTVSGSTTPAPTTPTPTTPAPTVTTPVVTSNTSGSLLTTIQTMQAQLGQMLLAIQAMQAQLAQLAGSVSPASGVSSASAPSAFSGSFVSLLNLNSTGSEVTALQQKLIKGGYLSGNATGFFGPATQAALKKFQSANGIDPAGYTGPSTRAALNAQ
jgi:N-acetylmuramoyl-L-alanine amidase